MSIPLVQNNDKDAINTSIIAIKRNIERINMLLGLVDNDSPDLSGFATKQELQDAVTELQPVDEVTSGNMQSVSSNAVAQAMSYSTEEHQVGYWTDGKPLYERSVLINIPQNGGYTISIQSGIKIREWKGNYFQGSVENYEWVMYIPYCYISELPSSWLQVYVYFDSTSIRLSFIGGGTYASNYYSGQAVITYRYTKNSDY